MMTSQLKPSLDFPRKNGQLISHNVLVNGKRTSIRLEKEMWLALKDIARYEKCSVHDLCSMVSEYKKNNKSLTSSVRVFVLSYFKEAATAKGHQLAGHGSGKEVVIPLIQKHSNTPYYGLREFKQKDQEQHKNTI